MKDQIQDGVSEFSGKDISETWYQILPSHHLYPITLVLTPFQFPIFKNTERKGIVNTLLRTVVENSNFCKKRKEMSPKSLSKGFNKSGYRPNSWQYGVHFFFLFYIILVFNSEWFQEVFFDFWSSYRIWNDKFWDKISAKTRCWDLEGCSGRAQAFGGGQQRVLGKRRRRDQPAKM